MWTFVFQLLCINLLFYDFRTIKPDDGGSREIVGFGYKIYPGDASLNMIRIVCTFLLHVSILSEISSAKEMMSFAKKNVSFFSD